MEWNGIVKMEWNSMAGNNRMNRMEWNQNGMEFNGVEWNKSL